LSDARGKMRGEKKQIGKRTRFKKEEEAVNGGGKKFFLEKNGLERNRFGGEA